MYAIRSYYEKENMLDLFKSTSKLKDNEIEHDDSFLLKFNK